MVNVLYLLPKGERKGTLKLVWLNFIKVSATTSFLDTIYVTKYLSKLNRTIWINILNFKYLKTEKFHTGYRLKEIETNEELTDIIEMHFIEIPKLSNESDEKDILKAWTEFLRNPESEKVRNLEMSIEEIREAKDELIRMSNDEKQREIYEMRAKILKDKVSALNEAERKGIQTGEKNKAIEIAKNLLDILDDETVATKTGLSIDVIKSLR